MQLVAAGQTDNVRSGARHDQRNDYSQYRKLCHRCREHHPGERGGRDRQFADGVFALFGATVTIDDATIKNVLTGVDASGPGAVADVRDTTITGRKGGPDQGCGVLFDWEAGGRIDDTAISKFFDDNPDAVSCGFGLTDIAGSVEIDDVSIPRPGNEPNVCDPATVFSPDPDEAEAEVALRTASVKREAISVRDFLVERGHALDRPTGDDDQQEIDQDRGIKERKRRDRGRR